MAAGTGIEWTEVTWNPTTGCDRISAGCDNCYALALAKRLKAMGQPKYQNDGDPRTSGPGFGLTIHGDALGLPYTWTGHRIVFVNSTCSTPGFRSTSFAGCLASPPTRRSTRIRC
jgi:protein gp37